MTQFLEGVRQIVEQVVSTLGYPGIALIMFAENFFPPLPSETMMLFSGFLVGEGKLSLHGVLIAGTAGMLLGALLVYYLGRWLDDRVIRAFVNHYGRFLTISERELDRALAAFSRYGGLLVVFGRFIPIIRALIALPAGMSRMPLRRFILFITLGSVLYNSVQVLIGAFLGENWTQMLTFVEQYEDLVIVGAAALIVALVVFWYARSRTRLREPA